MEKQFPKITLRAARVNSGLSQEKAAEILGITERTLFNYESGVTVPKWDMVHKMEDVYHFPSDFIFFGRNSL